MLEILDSGLRALVGMEISTNTVLEDEMIVYEFTNNPWGELECWKRNFKKCVIYFPGFHWLERGLFTYKNGYESSSHLYSCEANTLPVVKYHGVRNCKHSYTHTT
jgi:hypothetical protein